MVSRVIFIHEENQNRKCDTMLAVPRRLTKLQDIPLSYWSLKSGVSMGSEGKTTYHFKLNACCVVLQSYTDKVEEGNKTPYGFAGTIFCI